jgi:hypothetical protein
MVQEKRSASASLMGMLHERLRGLLFDSFTGLGVPKTGGLLPTTLACVVNVNHLRVYRPLPAGVGSVAFTHTLYVVEYARPESDNDFVPFDAPLALFVCPLHCIVQ